MAILRHVAEAEDGLTLQALSARTKLLPSTLHNLARTLLEAGFLAKTRQPVRYVLGPAPAELIAAQQRTALPRRASAAVLELAQTLGRDATVTFSQLHGVELSVTFRVSPQQPGALERPTHRTLSPYSSASSLAVLAFAGEESGAAYGRAWPFEEYGRARWSSRRTLARALTEARRAGCVWITDSELARAAAPVRTQGGELAGILGVALPPERARRKTFILRTLSNIAGRIGPSDPAPSANTKES